MLTSLRNSAVAAAVLVTVMLTPVAAADSWSVDNVHSSLLYKIFHAGAGYFIGHFDTYSGTITADAANPALSSVNIEIDAASVNSRNAKRDEHLRGPDFFNVAEHPTITFSSTAVKAVSDTAFDVTGDLTMLGVTKPVTARVLKTGEKLSEEAGKSKIGFFTTFTIRRSDFGMSYGIDGGSLGDEVELTLSVEATR